MSNNTQSRQTCTVKHCSIRPVMIQTVITVSGVSELVKDNLSETLNCAEKVKQHINMH